MILSSPRIGSPLRKRRIIFRHAERDIDARLRILPEQTSPALAIAPTPREERAPVAQSWPIVDDGNWSEKPQRGAVSVEAGDRYVEAVVGQGLLLAGIGVAFGMVASL